ncbi:hypothetical protein HMPREF1868_00681 [Olsenella sp. DNF00959]|nr:hypothetical protein HMPREF1868_00681 [Olsenella sp. DNF00959]
MSLSPASLASPSTVLDPSSDPDAARLHACPRSGTSLLVECASLRRGIAHSTAVRRQTSPFRPSNAQAEAFRLYTRTISWARVTLAPDLGPIGAGSAESATELGLFRVRS